MRRELIDTVLCCPTDGAFPLELRRATESAGEVREGALGCPACLAEYPIHEGIAHMLPAQPMQHSDVAEAKNREQHARDADAAGYDASVPEFHTRIEVGALLGAVDVREGDVVLDAGAGTGRLTVELARRGATVFACDLSARSLEVNARRCRCLTGATVHAIAADACYLPLRDGVAHKAVSGMMLEHLPTAADRARSLGEVRRVLRPGGALALTAYNYSLRKRRSWPREGYHTGGLFYRNLTRPELRQLMEVFEVATLTGLLNLPARLRSETLEKVVSRVPQVATLLGDLLLAVGRRPS